MKIDALYFAASCLVQICLALLLPASGDGGWFPHDALTTGGFASWAALCAFGFAAYPWVRPFPRTAPRLLFASVFAHLAAIFVASTLVSFLIITYAVPGRLAVWQDGLAIVLAAAVAGVTALLFSYARFCFSRHA